MVFEAPARRRVTLRPRRTLCRYAARLTPVELIDAGAPGLFGPTLGRLAKNLEASGYKPEQVDEIVVTHSAYAFLRCATAAL